MQSQLGGGSDGPDRAPGSAPPSQRLLSQAQLEEAWEAFVRFLKGRQARVTEARKIVLTQALRRDDHFRADDLAADLAEGPQRVSRGTVYRTLALLVEAGLVHEIRDDDQHVHYEALFGRGRHQHMVCDRCGRFLEFTDERIDQAVREQARQRGFATRLHRTIVLGTCRQCLEESD